MSASDDRRLEWRTRPGRPREAFDAYFDGELVGSISTAADGLPMYGRWDYSLCHHSAFRIGTDALRLVKMGNVTTRQEAADEVTRLWFMVYDEYRRLDLDWRRDVKDRGPFVP